MTKRLLSLLLALVTVFSLSIPAYAESGEIVDMPEITEAMEPETPAEEPGQSAEPTKVEPLADPEEFIEVIAINAPAEFAEAEEETPADKIVLLSADEPQTMAAVKNGLVKDSDGVMRYYTNGKVDTTKTGVAQLADKSSGSWYYVEKGVFKKATGIAQRADKSNTNWYYIKDGVYTKATGIAQKADKSSSAWYYVKNGVYTKVTGVAQKADKSSSAWYYVQNGTYTKATGLAQRADKSNASWYYVQNGSYLKTYTGLAPRISDGKLFYVKNGTYLKTFNGQVTYKGTTYTVKNGAAVVSSGTGTATNLSAPEISTLANASNGVTIKWGAVSGAAKYRVFYKNGSSWTKVADTSSTSYTWTGAKSNTVYTFTVRCLSADGKSYTSDYDIAGKAILYIPAGTKPTAYTSDYGTLYAAGEIFRLEHYGFLKDGIPGYFAELRNDFIYIGGDRLGSASYAAAGIPFPADEAEFAQQADVQSRLPEALRGKPFSEDKYGNVYMTWTDTRWLTYLVAKVQRDASGQVVACGYLELFLPKNGVITDEMLQWLSLSELAVKEPNMD